MTRDDRVASRLEIAFEDVDVGSADAAGLDLHDDVGRTGGRVIDSPDPDLMWLLDDDSFHLTAPMVRPRINCLWAINPARSTGKLASVAAADSFA